MSSACVPCAGLQAWSCSGLQCTRRLPENGSRRSPPLLLAERDLALSGKCLRGSTREATDALQVATRVGVTEGQVWMQCAVPDGDEAVAAALALPEAFLLEGKVISADAGLVCLTFVQNAVEKRISIGLITPS